MKEYTPDYVKCCQFDHYCKLVLYHEAIDYLREMQRYRKYQISLEDISLAQWDKFSTRDEYPSDSFVFSAFGYALHIRDELVAGAGAANFNSALCRNYGRHQHWPSYGNVPQRRSTAPYQSPE